MPCDWGKDENLIVPGQVNRGNVGRCSISIFPNVQLCGVSNEVERCYAKEWVFLIKSPVFSFLWPSTAGPGCCNTPHSLPRSNKANTSAVISLFTASLGQPLLSVLWMFTQPDLNYSTYNLTICEGIAESPYTFFSQLWIWIFFSSEETNNCTLHSNSGYQLKRQFHLKWLLHNISILNLVYKLEQYY